jgi:tetratricopeptide (TPR) repeat protein
LAFALIVVAALLAYQNSFTGVFVFDDIRGIVNNPYVRHLWPLRETLKAPAYSTPDGRPVVCFSLALSYACSGLNVQGYHAFNLTVHILAALVLFGVLRRTFLGERLRPRFGSVAGGLALAVTLIWTVHPLQTESVVYISQRTELLMGLFLLLTIYCLIRSADSPRSWAWQVGAVTACTLGTGSKEVMVAAPVVALVYDRVFLAASFRDLWRQRWRLYAGLTGTWVFLIFLVVTTPRAMTGFGIANLTVWAYLKTEAGVILHYLRLCVWPRPLILDYDDWPIATSLQTVIAPAVAVVALLTATAWALRCRSPRGFLGAWFFLILAPTSSFLPNYGEVAAERRMYLPLAAVVTFVVASGYEGLVVVARRVGARENQRRFTTYGVVGLIVVTVGYLTVRRNKDYRSEISIWADTVAKRPQNPRAHYNLGSALLQAGRLQDAIRHNEQALQINPNLAEAHCNLGSALLQAGRLQDAIRHNEQALQINPNLAEAHCNLGNALLQGGRVQDAIGHYEQAVRIKPDYAEPHYNLGNALLQAGRLPDAISRFEQVLQIRPDYAEAHNNLGNALLQAGRRQDAIGHYEQAVRIKPDYADAHYNLGNALLQAGRLQDAISRYEQALQIRPDYTEAQLNLGVALLQLGRSQEAIRHFEQALRIKPDNADAHYDLGLALLQAGKLEDAIGHFERGLGIAPDDALAHYNLGNALFRLGKVREAAAQYEQALRLQPDFAEAKASLARLRAVQ